MSDYTSDQINEIIVAWMPERPGPPFANLLDYAGNACLVQPMLDRCEELGWGVDYGYHTIKYRCDNLPVGKLVHVFVWLNPDVVTEGHELTLSDALTQAIVAMIEATSKGDTKCAHCGNVRSVNGANLCGECSQSLSDFAKNQL